VKRITAILTAAALLAACGGGDTADSTTTITDAGTATTHASAPQTTGGQTEALVLYSGRNENFVQPVIEAFTAETGIEVEARYAGTGELATTILAEGEDTLLGPGSRVHRWHRQGRPAH
jgi:iron(III) transport system substrate-binding protein